MRFLADSRLGTKTKGVVNSLPSQARKVSCHVGPPNSSITLDRGTDLQREFAPGVLLT